MKSSTISTLFVLLAPTLAQNLIPSSFPSCAQQCSLLQQAATSCMSNPTAAQSCFCQSALLSQLYGASPVSICSQCSAADMLTIQNGYKSTCKAEGAPAAANVAVPASPSTTTTTSATSKTTTSATTSPTAGAAVPNQQDTSTTNPPSGPWMSTHWKWVVMIVVLAVGLSILAIGGALLHRRYHNKREAQWAQTAVLPNINTWGPGQSVHDLGYSSGGAIAYGEKEKGKAKEQVRGVNEPVPARMREFRSDGSRF
ncbi:hypothetical protein P7C71_g5121, partial [Lecanoromycetidae sp. Uapishka_2]